jgi:ribosomal protein S18 acetylase RimI-like enzyme
MRVGAAAPSACYAPLPMSDLACRPLVARDVPVTAALLARAFADNPCYAWMHPRARTRAADLRDFFDRNLVWHLPLGMTWVATRGERVVGTLTLEPPGGVKHGAAKTLTHWVLPTLRHQGPRTVRRIAATDADFRRRYLAITEGRSYFHVHAVAVDPHDQGTGVGTAIVAHGMRELARARTAPRVPVVLSTQRERNLPLYRRAGFELVSRQGMGSRRDSFESWFLKLA